MASNIPSSVPEYYSDPEVLIQEEKKDRAIGFMKKLVRTEKLHLILLTQKKHGVVILKIIQKKVTNIIIDAIKVKEEKMIVQLVFTYCTTHITKKYLFSEPKMITIIIIYNPVID